MKLPWPAALAPKEHWEQWAWRTCALDAVGYGWHGKSYKCKVHTAPAFLKWADLQLFFPENKVQLVCSFLFFLKVFEKRMGVCFVHT